MAKTQTQNQVGFEIAKKLSIGELGYDKGTIQALVLADKENPHFICRFLGVATGTRAFMTQAEINPQTGEVVRPSQREFGLLGDFKGTGANGNQLESSTLYIPKYLVDPIANILMSDPEAAVEVTLDIYASYSTKSATSYEFSARGLKKIENPMMQALEASIADLPLPLTLAAPKS